MTFHLCFTAKRSLNEVTVCHEDDMKFGVSPKVKLTMQVSKKMSQKSTSNRDFIITCHDEITSHDKNKDENKVIEKKDKGQSKNNSKPATEEPYNHNIELINYSRLLLLCLIDIFTR